MTMKDMQENNRKENSYSIIRAGDIWQMISYNGIKVTETD